MLVFLCLRAQQFDKETEREVREGERATYTQRQSCIKNILDNRRGNREQNPARDGRLTSSHCEHRLMDEERRRAEKKTD